MLPNPYNRWPYSESPHSNNCGVCGAVVQDVCVRFEQKGIEYVMYQPSSEYWNDEKKAVYCGAAHSLQDALETNRTPLVLQSL